MKIYLLRQHQNTGYDTFNCIVVVAKDEDSARKIHPCVSYDGNMSSNDYYWKHNNYWCKTPDDVIVEYVGEASPIFKKEEILLASFNSG